jgi:uncharacterized RDD family membrane protein YckC
MNPYAAPAADLDSNLLPGAGDDLPLASRLSRLGAGLLDGLVYLAACIPIFGAGIWAAATAEVRRANPDSPSIGAGVLVLGVLGGVLVLAVLIFQVYRVSTTGQTLGKKWLDIRIVKRDGSPVTFSSAVLLRSFVPSLLGAIPYVGWIFGLLNILFIFRDDRRCLHDHIADTRVVDVGTR